MMNKVFLFLITSLFEIKVMECFGLK